MRRGIRVLVVVGVLVLAACSRPIIPVVVAPVTSGAPTANDRSESFSYQGVDYTIELRVVYHRDQLAEIDATLATAAGGPAAQGAALTLQEIDFTDTAALEPITSPCFDTADTGRRNATDQVGTVRCGHPFVVRSIVPGSTAPPSPVGALSARVLVSDTGADGYDPVAVAPASVVHTFGYSFA